MLWLIMYGTAFAYLWKKYDAVVQEASMLQRKISGCKGQYLQNAAFESLPMRKTQAFDGMEPVLAIQQVFLLPNRT